MNKERLNIVKADIDEAYKDLIPIANDIVKKCTEDIDRVIKEVTSNIENLSNDNVRDCMLKLSLLSFSFSEIKEKSAFKAEIARMMQKEKYAVEYNAAEGAVALRDSTATLNSSEERVMEMIYGLVSDTLKIKLDETHRVVDTLKSVLTSRLSEAKFMNLGSTNEIAPTTNGKVNVNDGYMPGSYEGKFLG